MSSSRISRGGRPMPGSFNAEFTPGQMVMGICVFLLVAVLCFGAGVLVGRHEPKPAVDPLAMNPATPVPEPNTKPASDSPTTKSAPPANTPTTAPTPPPATTPTPTPPPPRSVMPTPEAPPAGTPSHKADAGAPRSVDLPPLPTTKSSNRAVEVPVQVDAQPIPTPAPAEAATPAPTPAETAPVAATPPPVPTTKSGANTKSGADTKAGTPPVSSLPPLPKSASADTKKPATTPVDPEEALMGSDLLEPISAKSKKSAATPKATTPATGTKTAAAEEKPAAPASGGGSFGLQVGAFPGPNREAQAADLKKRAEAAGLRAEIRPSKDKQYYRVVITGYGDRASALKALNDIKQRPGFEKAFVQDLSKL